MWQIRKEREANPRRNKEKIMASGKVDIGGWISEAWELYKANFALICVSTLVVALLGAFTCGVLAGPLWAGLVMILLRLMRKGQPVPQIGDVFKGFDLFLQALLLFLVVGLAFAVVGSVPVIGPVAPTLISPLVMFAMFLVVDKKLEFWPAIQASFEKAKEEYVSLLVLSLVAGLISAAGLILCGIGVILTAPFGAVVSAVAYKHLFEGPEAEAIPVVEAIPVPQA
jgi:hypothetical protein